MVDALLLLSFGGPEGPDEVIPFLENVTRGRGVPQERLESVAEHYLHFGGVSPINEQNRALLAAIRADLERHGPQLPVYWGNRNWHPLVEDVVQEMADDGISDALVFVTSAYASYSACRQYQDDVARAAAAVGARGPTFAKLRHYFDHPSFVDPHADAVRRAVAAIPPERRATSQLTFTAHSIPIAMAAASGPQGGLYVAQLTEASRLVAERAQAGLPWELVFQSRSGGPATPWLGPDVGDHIRQLASEGITDVVVVPVGFTSDHLEVRWDLDVEAAATAEEVGVRFTRTATPGTDPRFVAMVRQLVMERLDAAAAKPALSPLGPAHDTCPAGCCLER